MRKIPVLLLIFNRPDTTEAVFKKIREYQPSELYIAADGPRKSVSTDSELIEKTKNIVSLIDWPCQVRHRYLNDNLGCTAAVKGAIDWFFSNVEEGVILEDDCVPDLSFFRFSAELLEYYRDVPKIMHISGDNFIQNKKRGHGSYYFSRYTYVWGWATWARAWKYYDSTIEADKAYVWDTQWRLSVERQGGLAVLPNVNLVSNIGCAHPAATHTQDVSERYANLKTWEMKFPLVHPKFVRDMSRYADYTPSRPNHTLVALYVLPLVGFARSLLKQILPLKMVRFLNRYFRGRP